MIEIAPQSQSRRRRATIGSRRDRGFSLMAALFVILVLAALGAFAVRISVSQQQTAAFDLLNARAQSAADGGIEYGANRALKAASCPGSTTFNLAAAGLAGFRVTVTCAVSLHTIGYTSYSAYLLSSTAQQGTYGSADFVQRQVIRTVTNAP
jgi:MSHA biogenesis protein MshP